jgi:creatinine amidohydrolase
MQDTRGVSIGHFYPWKVMTTWGPELFGGDWKTAFGHGAEPNTSVLRYLMPDRVDMAHAAVGGLTPYGGRRMVGSRYVEIDGVQSQIYIDTKRINDTSVTGGDPNVRPDPALGREFVDRCTRALVQFIDWLREQRMGRT